MDGRTEGRLEGVSDVARKAKAQGLSLEVIMALTGLSEDEIEEI